MELHSKALKYLRQHTKRCIACGEIQFARLLGKTAVQEIKRTKLIDLNEVHQLEETTYVKEEAKNGILSEISFESSMDYALYI